MMGGRGSVEFARPAAFFRMLVLAAFATLAGCAVGPDAHRPEMDMPADWREPTPAGEAVANLPWWDMFRDPVLADLIRLAIRNNRDLAVAGARIEEARGRMVATRAGLFPSFGSQVVLDKELLDVVSGTMSWEIDVWGKLRRATEASRADLLATEYIRDGVVLTLVSDVASTWVQLCAFDEQLDIALNTLDTRRRSRELIAGRFRGGIAPELDVFQVEGLEFDAAAQVAQFERAVRQTENALSVLLGVMSQPIEHRATMVDLAGSVNVPAGIPAEILDRRPDIKAAEAVLAAETARVGVAIGQRLPAFALTAAGGTASPDVEHLFTYDGTWTVALNVLTPIFEFGRRKALTEAQRARMEAARFEYEQQVLVAVRDVNDALVAIRTFDDERTARRRTVEAARGAVRLSFSRYDGGVTTYLEVLDAERTRFTSELALVDAATGRVLSLIQLYKALGGGWQNFAAAPPASTQPLRAVEPAPPPPVVESPAS
jgi:outer membrane protein, multidrug efflux system